ncbi:MAG: carboxypeptidase regulatory-like domain-containing protein [Myxococcaceae bacterium]|nr:carboxypeptidase regulatory-like domain-containing protein [Myxococcaceae bacterium]
MKRSRLIRWPALAMLLMALGGWWLSRASVDPGPMAPEAAASAAIGSAALAPAPSPRPPREGLGRAAVELSIPPAISEAVEASPGEVQGRVISESTRQPVPKAELTFATPGGAQSIVTSGDGTFRFAPKKAGQYQVASVKAEGYVPFGPDWGKSPISFVCRPGWRVRNITVVLTPAQDMVGVVVAAKGVPVPGVTARLLAPRAEEAALFPTADTFVTDAKGEFRFQGYEELIVEAIHGNQRGRARVDRDAVHDRKLVITLEANEGGQRDWVSLKGRVVSPGEQPVAGALVTASTSLRAYPKTFGDQDGYRTLTGPDGQFELSGLEAGRYDVSARSLGSAPTYRFDVKVPAQLVLKLGAAGTLKGKISVPSGAPLPSFALELDWQKAPLERLDLLSTTVVDADGAYQLTGLEPGQYVLTVKSPGFAPAEWPFAMPAGTLEQTLDITLEHGRVLSGTVQDAASRAPIADARVAVEGLNLRLGAETFSDATGAFHLDGLPEQAVTLQLSARGYHTLLLPAAGTGPFTALLTKVDPDGGTQIQGVGIGAVLRGREDVLVIGMVMPNGGAFEAGLKVGDEVFSVDGTPVSALGFGPAIMAIRGPPGTTVKLGVRKGGQAPVVEVTAVRKKIQA